MPRSLLRKCIDFLTFPVRAVTLFEHDKFCLSSLATERFDYVSREVRGRCLDVGCGRGNRFIKNHLGGEGVGVDVYAYEGLAPENLVEDLSTFPFPDESFGTVTFIANVNHIPRSKRDAEFLEAYRCLVPGGRIIITMGHPLAEILVHRVVAIHDRLFGTRHDMDGERGMSDEEAFFLPDSEIVRLLSAAGFREVRRKLFGTQWGLNHMFIAVKPASVSGDPPARQPG